MGRGPESLDLSCGHRASVSLPLVARTRHAATQLALSPPSCRAAAPSTASRRHSAGRSPGPRSTDSAPTPPLLPSPAPAISTFPPHGAGAAGARPPLASSPASSRLHGPHLCAGPPRLQASPDEAWSGDPSGLNPLSSFLVDNRCWTNASLSTENVLMATGS